jgi:hypothetical protein
MPFVRLLSLGVNIDINPVNGSYSLDNVVVVNHPSPNKDDNDDDDDDDNGDGDGGRFSTLPLLPALTFIVIGSSGMPSLMRRVISTSLLLWECLTACKALSHANAKGTGTNDWVIRSLDD